MKIKKIDKFLNKKYKAIKNTFIGATIIKLISEILLACLIAGAVYCASTIYNNKRDLNIENDKLYSVHVMASEEFVSELFGAPYISFIDEYGYTNHYYKLNDVILRTVSENDHVIGYFITSRNPKRKIPVDSYEIEQRIIGVTKYEAIDNVDATVQANLNMNGRYAFYSETKKTANYARFDNYIYAILPYGFIEDKAGSLVENTALNNDLTEDKLMELRKDVRPNTFGVIADGYEDNILVIPMFEEEWESMYYLLIKR